MRKVNRNTMGKFFKLSNGQYMKIIFSYKNSINTWFMNICVADTKRKCNDCINKTENSPKVLYGKTTGKRLGVEALLIAKNELLDFEKVVKNTEIRIIGASDRLNNVYRYLKRYGYEEKEITYNDGKVKNVMYKEIV